MHKRLTKSRGFGEQRCYPYKPPWFVLTHVFLHFLCLGIWMEMMGILINYFWQKGQRTRNIQASIADNTGCIVEFYCWQLKVYLREILSTKISSKQMRKSAFLCSRCVVRSVLSIKIESESSCRSAKGRYYVASVGFGPLLTSRHIDGLFDLCNLKNGSVVYDRTGYFSTKHELDFESTIILAVTVGEEENR